MFISGLGKFKDLRTANAGICFSLLVIGLPSVVAPSLFQQDKSKSNGLKADHDIAKKMKENKRNKRKEKKRKKRTSEQARTQSPSSNIRNSASVLILDASL